jgi:hypothetical protein
VQIHNPYQKQHAALDYKKWLMAMSDRCWRQTRSASSTTGVREIYPSDGTGDQFFKLPSIVKAFGVTIPSGAFTAQAGDFILGIIEFKSHYEFS